MKKTRFTETQIAKALKEMEGGRAADHSSREMEISKATLCGWKGKYGGMESSDVKRLKELEDEKARLKRMYAELSLDHTILKDVITKKGWGPAAKES
jgi:putative transposase